MPEHYNKTQYGLCFQYNLNNKNYTVEIHYPNNQKNYNIPYILVLPEYISEDASLVVEANNLEKEKEEELLNNALITAHNLVSKLEEFYAPVLIPILPSTKTLVPYYQQLSKECFTLPQDDIYFRIDIQVLNIINEVLSYLSNKAKINNKIFLNGYSSSGVFAQRFALLHPEIVQMACIGGASGSIPVPTDLLDYPLGIKDYKSITGEEFDIESYSKIIFRYYVGELESVRKSMDRLAEDGSPAPMHDMSYFERSVEPFTGYKQRKLFGIDLLKRSAKEIGLLKSMGIDILQEIMKGRTHNNQSGTGVNELGDQFVKESYQELITKVKKL